MKSEQLTLTLGLGALDESETPDSGEQDDEQEPAPWWKHPDAQAALRELEDHRLARGYMEPGGAYHVLFSLRTRDALRGGLRA